MNNSVPLSDCISLFGGGTPSKQVPEYWNGKIPWASVKDLKSTRLIRTKDSITELGLKNSSSKLVKSGTIIIATRMAVGKAAITDIDVAINQDLKAIVCKESIDVKYLFYFLSSSVNEFAKVSSGATVKGIKLNHILDLKIPLPPLAKQKQIAAILDAADSLRQKDQQLVEHYTTLSQSLFSEMFGDFIENPKGFEQSHLGDVLSEKNSIKCGPFGSQLKIGEFVENGIPVYGIDNVQLNKFVNAKPKFITEDKFKELIAFNVSNNDLLISRTGTVGRACLAPEVDKAVIGPNLLKVRVQNSNFNPIFLTFAFNYSTSIINQIKLFSPGATVAVYNTRNLKKLKVLIPPIELQNQFAKYVALLEKQKQQAQTNLQKSEALFNSLLQRAFTGELTADKAA